MASNRFIIIFFTLNTKIKIYIRTVEKPKGFTQGWLGDGKEVY